MTDTVSTETDIRLLAQSVEHQSQKIDGVISELRELVVHFNQAEVYRNHFDERVSLIEADQKTISDTLGDLVTEVALINDRAKNFMRYLWPFILGAIISGASIFDPVECRYSRMRIVEHPRSAR